MVRLKAGASPQWLRGKPPFQFHSGSIKSTPDDSYVWFGFSFNSIVVRLKVDKVKNAAMKALGFQFHSGSIKSAGRDQGRAGSGMVSIP